MTPEQLPSRFILGSDPGFGNDKVCFDGHVSIVQSAVARPNNVGLAAIGMKSAARHVRLARFDGYTFAVGRGAWQRGEPITSMDYSSLAAPGRRALFYTAVSEVLPPLTDGDPPPQVALVMGLPVPLLQDETQAGVVIESLKGLKGGHAFEIDDTAFGFVVKRIKVVAQPVGAYVDWLYDDDLKMRPRGSRAEVAILDIGMNTLDLYVVQGGQVLERHIGGAEVGVRRLLDLVASNGHDLVELDADLRCGRLKPTDTQLDMWLGEILAALKRSWPSLRRFTAVIPTGGGALVLGDRLRNALAAKGAALHWPDDPIAANVRGFWKYGRKYAL